MGKKSVPAGTAKKKSPGISNLLKPYRGMIFLLIFFALLSNGINLVLPRIIASGIDAFPSHYVLEPLLIKFLSAAVVIFIFTFFQSIIQTNTSERVARDLRARLALKISTQSYDQIEKANPSKLLTNLTADVDSVKTFISTAIVTVASSLIIIIGASIMLFSINVKLASAIVVIIPIISGVFYYVSKKVRPIFIKGREVIDRLNKVINESILGAAIIRVVNSQQAEYNKFLGANTKARDFGLSILKLFAGLIPVITFTSNIAALTILALGGHFVISGSMTIGNFAAFNSYLAMLIFPILVIGFMSGVIAQATASYQRISNGSVIKRPCSGLASFSPHSRKHIHAVARLLLTTGLPVASSIRAMIRAARTAVHEMNSASESRAVASRAKATISSCEIRAISRSSVRPRHEKRSMAKSCAAKYSAIGRLVSAV